MKTVKIDVTIGHDLPSGQTALAVDTWNLNPERCYEAMEDGKESGAPELPRTLMGWLLFTQWAWEEYGSYPDGT